jgi:hypothetical protein
MDSPLNRVRCLLLSGCRNTFRRIHQQGFNLLIRLASAFMDSIQGFQRVTSSKDLEAAVVALVFTKTYFERK